MPTSPIVLLLYLWTFLACAFALWKGGTPERFGGGVVFWATLAPPALHAVAPASLSALIDLTGDGVVGVAFLLLVLRFGSPWLGVIMLLYAGEFALHATYVVTQRPPDRLHAEINNILFLGVSFSLLIAAALAWRRRLAAART